jgi:hypothetical protein
VSAVSTGEPAIARIKPEANSRNTGSFSSYVPAGKQLFHVCVKQAVAGRPLWKFEVKGSDTVQVLKEKMLNSGDCAIPYVNFALSWRANLSHGFKFLLDSRTMDSYHLTDGEVLYLIAQRKPLATYLAGGRYEEIGLLKLNP